MGWLSNMEGICKYIVAATTNNPKRVVLQVTFGWAKKELGTQCYTVLRVLTDSLEVLLKKGN
jgi:hypothetical protein